MTSAKQPLVSIIVPVYNVEAYVDECMASIRTQTYTNLEILVVEDCSTDGSSKALSPHLEDPRVHLIQHTSNKGLSAARNTGIEAARGDYVMFVDSDDAIEGMLVERCVKAAEQEGAEILLYGFTPFKDGEDLPPLSGYTDGDKLESVEIEDYFVQPHFAWLKFIRRALLRNKALRFPVGHYYEDWPFHWELAFVAESMVRLQRYGYFYRQRGGSITASKDQKLFHVFSAHLLVADIVDRHAAGNDAQRALANKIYHGTWVVLTTIDEVHLPEAITRAKEHFSATRKQRRFVSANRKAWFVKALLSLPEPLAGIGVLGLRKLLAARRKMYLPREPVRKRA